MVCGTTITYGTYWHGTNRRFIMDVSTHSSVSQTTPPPMTTPGMANVGDSVIILLCYLNVGMSVNTRRHLGLNQTFWDTSMLHTCRDPYSSIQYSPVSSMFLVPLFFSRLPFFAPLLPLAFCSMYCKLLPLFAPLLQTPARKPYTYTYCFSRAFWGGDVCKNHLFQLPKCNQDMHSCPIPCL